MIRRIRLKLMPAALLGVTLTVSACATAPGPVEVTRFVGTNAADRLGTGTIFVESPAGAENSLALAPYKQAVAMELVRLGYRETGRAAADQIAQVRIEHFTSGGDDNRGPVSVGVGGSTGSYGSGVGLGIGINLGGGSREEAGTQLAVVIRDKKTDQVLWEGRANFAVASRSPLAHGSANAQTMAGALFSDFPGNNGETIYVGVTE